MKWLTNIYDPEQPDAYEKLIIRKHESREEAWREQENWLADKVIGLPKETSYMSVKRLIEQKLVGVYKDE